MPPHFAPYPQLYSAACYHAKSHETADLCAQWRAALAAERAAGEAKRATTWAIVAALLSAATVIGLIITIWQTFGALGEARRGNLIAQRSNARSTRRAVQSAEETKKALEISDRQATAAELAFKEASKTARAQLRTYIASDNEPYSADKTGRHISIPFDWKNVGQTPAHDTVITRRSVYVPSKVTEDHPSRDVGLGRVQIGTVGPGAKVESPHEVTLKPEEVEAIADGTARITSHIEIEYRDEFGDHWVYHHHLLVDEQSIRAGTQYTTKCETVRVEGGQESNPELPLRDGTKRRTKAKAKKAKRA